MADEWAAKADVDAVTTALDGLIDDLNKLNRKSKKYMDDKNTKQDQAMAALEQRLVELFDKKLQAHDRAIRKFISAEAKKVAKAFKK